MYHGLNNLQNIYITKKGFIEEIHITKVMHVLLRD